jgi:ATP-dependent Lon protease
VNQRSPQTKVIMLTAYATLDATIEAIREQVYDFFPKPVKIEDLKRSVKKALVD